MKSSKISGEAASADKAAALVYPEHLKNIIEEGQYSTHQIFNMEETNFLLENYASSHICHDKVCENPWKEGHKGVVYRFVCYERFWHVPPETHSRASCEMTQGL